MFRWLVVAVVGGGSSAWLSTSGHRPRHLLEPPILVRSDSFRYICIYVDISFSSSSLFFCKSIQRILSFLTIITSSSSCSPSMAAAGSGQLPVSVKFTKLFINGEFVDSVSGKTFETIDPRTGEGIARVAEGDREDVDLAVKAARHAFDHGPWPRMSGFVSVFSFSFRALV